MAQYFGEESNPIPLYVNFTEDMISPPEIRESEVPEKQEVQEVPKEVIMDEEEEEEPEVAMLTKVAPVAPVAPITKVIGVAPVTGVAPMATQSSPGSKAPLSIYNSDISGLLKVGSLGLLFY